MISPFTFTTVPQIIFGQKKIDDLPTIVMPFGQKILFVLGSNSFTKKDVWSKLKSGLRKNCVEYETVHIQSEPSPEIIDTIVANNRDHKPDVIVAIGGGSTLDAGKALSAMVMEDGGVSQFLESIGTKKVSGRKAPFIAIPTTAGTGSEATNNAVLSSVGEDGFKKSLRHKNYFPDIALIDPELALSCPKDLTIACGMDCFSQLVEAYLSTNSNTMTDGLAFDGLKAIQRSLRRVCTDGSNLAARADMAYATLISGMVLSNAGLGAVHGFAATIGGFFNIPHGIVCGTLMGATNRATLESLRRSSPNDIALTKYSQLGELFTASTDKSAGWYQDSFINELETLTADFKIPALNNFGLELNDFAKIAENTDNKYNPATLNREELSEILVCRLS